jgi:CubicO group peptidase (beta-lactamase class C family)
MASTSPHRRNLLGMGVAASAGLLAGPALAAARPPSGRFDWTLHPPESVGMTRAGLESVRAAVQKSLESHQELGVVTAIARRNKLVWFEAQGVRDPATGEPVRKDDIFRLASSTKPLTAACVLMMLEAGKLSLDDKVSRFIPTFADEKVVEPPPGWEQAMLDPKKRAEAAAQAKYVPAIHDVTIRELLTHTSGLMSAGDGGFFGPGTLVNTSDKMAAAPDRALAQVIPEAGHAALDYQPGTKWRYSPLYGFDTLLYLVELISGQPADVFMRERLFEPLGMRDSGFNLPPEKRARLVPLYERKNDAWKPATWIFGNGPVKYISGAGGVMSTVHDYMQFEAMLFNRGELNGRRILKPETVALMSTNQVGQMMQQWIPPVTAGMGYGLGVGVTIDPAKADNGRGLGAFGWDGALGTDGWVDHANDLAVVYFVQQAVRPVRVEFQKAVRAAIAAER